MKKIASIFAMLLMVLTLSISFNSCGGLTIGAAVAELQSKCPQDMGNGLTMTKADLVDGNMVITISAANGSADEFDANAGKASLIQFVKSDADFANLLKETNTAIIYKFVFSDGEGSVTVNPSDL
ncbi:MAG: hypothetical protein II075_09700 [Bacteroidales bacterium]|nr:hypothetical protein [Bacteroidales bacterium]